MTTASPEVTQQRHRRLTIAQVIHETADACTVVFSLPAADAAWFRYRPGQFVTIKVPHPGGEVARCYSLSSAPGDDRPAITIKRAGPASAWLCDNLAAGCAVDVLPPAGLFTPKSMDEDLLLIAAGSGITPIMSIVRAVLAHGSAHLTLLYANRDPDSVIFARQLELLGIRHTGRLRLISWLESAQGLPAAQALSPLLKPYADRPIFLCGPEPFMAEVAAALTTLEVPRRQVHRERFVSLDEDPFAAVPEPRVQAEPDLALPGPASTGASLAVTGQPAESDPSAVSGARMVEVFLDGEQHRLEWPDDVKLLDLLGTSGLAAPSSCRSGQCGACTTRVEEGEVRMLANDVLDAADLADGYILACQALGVSDLLRITYD